MIQSMYTLDDGLFTFYNRLTSVEEDHDGDNSTFTLIFPEIGLAAGESASRKFLSPDNYRDSRVRGVTKERNLMMNCFCAPKKENWVEEPTPIEDGNAERFTLTDEDGVEEAKLTKEDEAQIEILREDAQENDYAQSLQQQRNHDLQLIQALIMDYIQKYHADPTELIATSLQGKYVVNTMPMLVVNRDRKIIFPEYNEMELKMSAASRTLYIWFLLHPEGCRLKELSKHRADFIDIYEEVHPGSNYVEECVDALLQPDKLNQNLSRIKKWCAPSSSTTTSPTTTSSAATTRAPTASPSPPTPTKSTSPSPLPFPNPSHKSNHRFLDISKNLKIQEARHIRHSNLIYFIMPDS